MEPVSVLLCRTEILFFSPPPNESYWRRLLFSVLQSFHNRQAKWIIVGGVVQSRDTSSPLRWREKESQIYLIVPKTTCAQERYRGLRWWYCVWIVALSWNTVFASVLTIVFSPFLYKRLIARPFCEGGASRKRRCGICGNRQKKKKIKRTNKNN